MSSNARSSTSTLAEAERGPKMRPIRVIMLLLVLALMGLSLPSSSQAAMARDGNDTFGAVPTGSPWKAESNQAFALLGRSVGTAGDVNGDGFDDVIMGADFYDNGQTDEGGALVYQGGPLGLPGTPNWTAESNQFGALFGYSVATAGDVNGDGFDDVIVGALSYDNGQTDEGRAFVYHGSVSGLSATPNWTAESDQASAVFGGAVSTAGDVNGDGFDDVIVGASIFDNGQTDEGRVFVYHGSVSGLSATPNWTAESDQVSAWFGISVATAGDVNGDGFDDVIVGAQLYDNGQTDEGGAFAYQGSASGLSATPNWTAESNQADAYTGRSVGTAGDVNGDGFDDVIVAAFFYDNGQTDEGRAFVYQGSASGLSVTPDWTAESNQAGAGLGFEEGVDTAGDMNGDGFDDVIVGAPWYDEGQQDEGAVFVFRGSSSGLSTTPRNRAEGNQRSAGMGSVGTAGDVNGDGYAEMIVGAPFYDHGETDEGLVAVYRGRA
jgi:hypothetical protein